MRNNLKKIIHLSILRIWDIAPGKGRVSTYLPLKGFAETGHEVWFFTSARGQSSGNMDGINVRQLKVPVRPDPQRIKLHWPFFILSSIISVLKNCKVRKPDVIYANTFYAALPAFLISRFMKAKYVMRLYGVGILRKPRSLFERIKRIEVSIAFYLPADLYILTNDGTSADKLARSYGIPEEKIAFLVNGIDKDYANRRTDYGLKSKFAPNGEKIVLSVSQLVRNKQVNLLIDAVPDILERYDNVKFLIVGDGYQRTKLEFLVRKLGVSDYVVFEGAVSHSKVVDYMNISDIFVSMNAYSSINNPIIEAMVSGKTVIALNTGRTEDLITHGETGVLVNVGEIRNLPNYIVDLLDNDVQREEIGKKAQRFILEKWPSWEDRINYEIQLIENLFRC